MKRIILCEGKTDAFLIGYFLKRKLGWLFTTKDIVKLPVQKNNEVLYWYRHQNKLKSNQELAIWGVGGIKQIGSKLQQIIDRNRKERNVENRFEKIVIFFDRDQRSQNDCLNMIKTWLNKNNLKSNNRLKLGQWVQASMQLNVVPIQNYNINLLPIVLPPDSPGTLETFLINALKKHSKTDNHLVNTTQKFIQSLPKDPYLNKQRLPDKACMGTILSVISPDWIFFEISNRLEQVEWEQLEDFLTTYIKLQHL